MPLVTTTEIGRYGEQVAADYLKKQGYRILKRNYRAGKNEIDLIVDNKTELVFVEVKTRSSEKGASPYGDAVDAVTYGKQKRTLAAARAYLYKGDTDKNIRFDVIEVYLEKSSRFFSKFTVKSLEHIVDAFGA